MMENETSNKHILRERLNGIEIGRLYGVKSRGARLPEMKCSAQCKYNV